MAMWYRLDESTGVRCDYVRQMNESVEYLRDSMIDDGIFVEAENRYLGWLKGKLMKLCPSPEKLREFFAGIGRKIDAKIQKSRYDSLKQAWGNIRDMATAQDCTYVEPEDVGLDVDGGEDVEDGETAMVAEEDDGVGEEGAGQSAGRARRRRPGSPQRKTPKGRATAKGTGANRPGAKRPAGKRPGAKRPGGKGGAARRPAKGGKASKSSTLAAIMKFLKGHWKQIVIVLLVALAVYFLGTTLAAWFATSHAAKGAMQALAKPGFSLPPGMDSLPPGAKLIANGTVRYANGSILSMHDVDYDNF